MIRRLMFVLAASSLIPVPAYGQAAPAQAPAAKPLPGFLAGCWIERQGERTTEECWTAPRAGTMLGTGRDWTGDRPHGWEALQILVEPDDSVAYWLSLFGVNRTRFGIERSGPNEVVFANPQNRYPQRVHYRREGDVLNLEMSLADGTRSRRWRFERAAW